jgi:hypothetical protein
MQSKIEEDVDITFIITPWANVSIEQHKCRMYTHPPTPERLLDPREEVKVSGLLHRFDVFEFDNFFIIEHHP